MYLKQFQSNYDLLSLTRSNENSLIQSDWYTHLNFKYRILDTGILELLPNDLTDKQIVLSSAIHGNETAPIEICNEMVKEIFLGDLNLSHHTLFIMGNPKAINLEKRFSIENLNRLFDGACRNKELNYEVKRAIRLEDTLKSFFKDNSEKIHYDLHTAIRDSELPRFAMYPYIPSKEYDQQQLNFLYHSGVQAVVLGHAPATTFSYHSSHRHQANSFTIELGKVKKFGENKAEDFIKINIMLRRLIGEKSLLLDDYDQRNFKIFEVHDMITKNTDEFKLLFSEDLKNFTTFNSGTKLSEDLDSSYTTKHDDEAVLFPNANVAKGQRAAVIIRPTSI